MQSKSSFARQRRAFIRIVPAASLLGLGAFELARAQAPAAVNEKDPQAVALGYVADGSKVDRAKYPKYAPGQSCANCGLYQGKAGDASGPCPLFPAKQVAAKGWCSAYVKKA